MKTPETVKPRSYRTARKVLGITLLVAGTVEAVGQLDNLTYEIPEGACASAMTVSKPYVNPNASSFWHAHWTGFGPTGVVAKGKVPKGAYGVQASFKSPDAPDKAWNENASPMIKADAAGNFAVKMAIGDGAVLFAMRALAPEGSPVCNTELNVHYTYLNRTDYLYQAADLPYFNLVTPVVNLINLFKAE